MKFKIYLLILFLTPMAQAELVSPGAMNNTMGGASTWNLSRARTTSVAPAVSALTIPRDGWVPSDPRLREVYIRFYRSGQINRQALSNAFKFYERNSCTYNRGQANCRPMSDQTMAIADFSLPPSQNRLMLLNLQTGRIQPMKTAHGAGSGGSRTSPPSRFSNVNGSGATPAGFHIASGVYNGRNGLSLRMHGLENRNSNSLRRAVVIHGGRYVAGGGRSLGCIVVEPQNTRTVVSSLRDNALVYNYNGQDVL